MPFPRLELGSLDLWADALLFELAGPGLAGNIILYFFFSFMNEVNLPPPFRFPRLGICMPICCMRQNHACLHAQGEAEGSNNGLL